MLSAVTTTELAEVLGLSERRIYQLVDKGMPREGRAAYDLGKCLRWYVAYRLKEQLATLPPTKLDDARLRHASALAGLRELELARLEGSLLSLDFVATEWADALAKIRSVLDQVPFRLAERLQQAHVLKVAMGRRTRRVLDNYLEDELLPALQKAGDSADEQAAGDIPSPNGDQR